jgi:hypothetical protein
MSDNTVYIHDSNLYKGWSIGDLFNSLVYLRQEHKGDKIVVASHKSLHPLIHFLFGDIVSHCIEHKTQFTKLIHTTFVDLIHKIRVPIQLHYTMSLLDTIPDEHLLPNNTILLICNRSDNNLLPAHVIDDILNVTRNQSVYIRNVIDNSFYKPSFLTLDIPNYSHDLMSLVKSCMTRKIKIIMYRCGLVDMLAYISTIPIFLIFPSEPKWVEEFSFEAQSKNVFLRPSQISEYKLSQYSQDAFKSQLKTFIEQ